MPTDNSSQFQNKDLISIRRELENKIKAKNKGGEHNESISTITKTDRERYPLSYEQERIWLLSKMQLEGSKEGYNLVVRTTLTGPVDTRLVEESLLAIQRKHEILRMRFEGLEEGMGTQFPRLNGTILKKINLETLSDTEKTIKCDQLLIDEEQCVLDLEKDSLFRSLLIKISSNRYQLILTVHQILCDGVSMRMLLRELIESYEMADTSGTRKVLLEELPIQYADYASWERQASKFAVIKKQLLYWEKAMQGVPLLSLYADKKRPSIESFHVETASIILPATFVKEIRQYCSQQGGTVFTLCMSVLQLLLFSYTQQRDFLIFFATTRRNKPELSELIGFFTNILVMRADIQPEFRFNDLFGRNQELLLEIFEHKDVPFIQLAQVLRPDRKNNQSPTFQVMLTFLNEITPPVTHNKLEWGSPETPKEIDKFDLHFFILENERKGTIKLSLRYKTELFEKDSIIEMLEHYRKLFELSVQPINSEKLRTPPIKPNRNCPVGEDVADKKRVSMKQGNKRIKEIRYSIRSIWEELLGREDFEEDDSFFSLGGHSLLVPQLVIKVNGLFSVDLPLSTVFSVNTIAGISNLIHDLQQIGISRESAVSLETKEVDLRKEVYLDPLILPSSNVQSSRSSMRGILLTGGTGFIGVHLLAELLENTDAKIYCLVRSDNASDGFRRITESLLKYNLWKPSFEEKIEGIASDISEPFFGLDKNVYESIALNVDTIFHCAAWVNFTYPYELLKSANVTSVEEVLRFSMNASHAPIHMVSTTGIFSPEIYFHYKRIHENDPLETCRGLSGGYSQSKWVADKIAQLAQDRGIPISIYRPGWVGGSGLSGLCNTKDLVWNLMKGCSQLGRAPVMDLAVDFATVDHVCASIVHIAKLKSPTNKIYHLLNTHVLIWNNLMEKLREAGFQLEEMPYSQWQTKLHDKEYKRHENALTPFASLFNEDEKWYQQTRLKLDHTNTIHGTVDLEHDEVSLDKLLDKYISTFLSTGFLSSLSRDLL